MNIEWRTSGVVALIAGILTVLIAGLAGRNFGTVLGRALVSGLLAGAVATGLQILVSRFLPELTELGTERKTDSATGQSVNLVVGDDGEEGITPPNTLAGFESAGEDSLDAELDEDESDVADVRGEDGVSTGSIVDVSSDSVAERQEEAGSSEIPESALQSHRSAAESEGQSGDDDAAVAEEIQEGQRAPVNDDDEEEIEELTSEGDLPEIGGLESSFRDISLDGESAADRKSSGEQGNSTGQDPAEIARALQTMMKRE